MIHYTGINHLAMATGDMDRTVRFWRDLLEMRMVAGLGKPGYRTYFLEISATDMISFFEWPNVEPLPEKDHGYPVTGPFVFDHLSIGVRELEDVWTLKDRLEAAGFWVSEVVDHGFIHSVYSFDPNGIPIELSWSVPDVDLRAHPVLVDSHPSPVTLEGPGPQQGVWPRVDSPTPREERRVYPGEGTELTAGTKRNWFEDTP
ncbi:MAG: VOC family protein [Syntrophobacteraceae bacterium]|jgi:catechol 2,3-dioxygenase-like lactoylglutathione lyase family enzyme|nr:VOC family protein [Syntrophobacteraceae bacterium]MCU0587511.1 VOC family protein [Syntrophobacteraceae bacterium]